MKGKKSRFVLGSSGKQAFREAVKEFREKTCLRFTPYTNEKDYLWVYRGSGWVKGCKKFIYEKKRLKSKLRRKYVLNLLSEPQHLAKIKTPKLHKFASKGVTNLRERKLKNNWLKLRENKQKYAENVHVSFSMSRLEFFDVIG